MKPHINILILDEDRYFALGLEILLRDYFMQKGEAVTFLPARLHAKANLVIQADKVARPVHFCHIRRLNQNYNVITIQRTTRPQCKRPVCISELGVLRRHDTMEIVLHLVKQLDEKQTAAQPLQCPRCSQLPTLRQWEVLHALRLGMVPSKVAEYLNLSIKTVSAHKCTAMRKLGFQRNAELYQWLQQGGLDIIKREFL